MLNLEIFNWRTKDAQRYIFWVNYEKNLENKKLTTIMDSTELMFGVQGKARLQWYFSGS